MKRIGAWQAFCRGVALVVRWWPLVLVFYGTLLLLSLAVLVPAEQVLLRTLGYRLASHELADGVDAWLVAGVLRTAWHDPDALVAFLRPILRTLPAWPLLANLPFVALSAGALSVYSGDAQRLWNAFASGLARWGPSFVGLLLVEVVLLEGALGATVGLLAWAYTRAPSLGLGLTLPATLLLTAFLLLLPWWFGYARVWIAVNGRANLLRGIIGGWRFLWGNLGAASVLELLLLACLLVVAAVHLLANRLIPGDRWCARVVVDQLLVATLVGIRLVRLASQAGLLAGRFPLKAGPEQT